MIRGMVGIVFCDGRDVDQSLKYTRWRGGIKRPTNNLAWPGRQSKDTRPDGRFAMWLPMASRPAVGRAL
jgi:hypothetical protein